MNSSQDLVYMYIYMKTKALSFYRSRNVLRRHKNQFYWMQIIFLSGIKCLWLAQYVNKFLVRHKKCGPTQNILGPVKKDSGWDGYKREILDLEFCCPSEFSGL